MGQCCSKPRAEDATTAAACLGLLHAQAPSLHEPMSAGFACDIQPGSIKMQFQQAQGLEGASAVLALSGAARLPSSVSQRPHAVATSTYTLHVVEATPAALEFAGAGSVTEYARLLHHVVKCDGLVCKQLEHAANAAKVAFIASGSVQPAAAPAGPHGPVVIASLQAHAAQAQPSLLAMMFTPGVWQADGQRCAAVFVEHIPCLQSQTQVAPHECISGATSQAEQQQLPQHDGLPNCIPHVSSQPEQLLQRSAVQAQGGEGVMTKPLACRLARMTTVLDVSPMQLTLCTTNGQVLYQNSSSLAYAGCWSLPGASTSGFPAALLSLQPDLMDDLLETVMVGHEPWMRVVQVPSSLTSLAPQAPCTAGLLKQTDSRHDETAVQGIGTAYNSDTSPATHGQGLANARMMPEPRVQQQAAQVPPPTASPGVDKAAGMPQTEKDLLATLLPANPDAYSVHGSQQITTACEKVENGASATAASCSPLHHRVCCTLDHSASNESAGALTQPKPRRVLRRASCSWLTQALVPATATATTATEDLSVTGPPVITVAADKDSKLDRALSATALHDTSFIPVHSQGKDGPPTILNTSPLDSGQKLRPTTLPSGKLASSGRISNHSVWFGHGCVQQEQLTTSEMESSTVGATEMLARMFGSTHSTAGCWTSSGRYRSTQTGGCSSSGEVMTVQRQTLTSSPRQRLMVLLESSDHCGKPADTNGRRSLEVDSAHTKGKRSLEVDSAPVNAIPHRLSTPCVAHQEIKSVTGSQLADLHVHDLDADGHPPCMTAEQRGGAALQSATTVCIPSGNIVASASRSAATACHSATTAADPQILESQDDDEQQNMPSFAAGDFVAAEADPDGPAQQADGVHMGCTAVPHGRGPVWHEVMCIPFLDPETNQQVMLIAQTDVTERSTLEQRLMNVTEGWMYMLENMFPKHILERIACSAANRPAEQQEGDTADNMLHLVKELQQGATHHDCVTIMFTDICGFTAMAKEVEPQQVMSFLNQLFSLFDDLVGKHKVYKVETAGDCYIVCAGLLDEDENGFRTLAADDKASSRTRAARRVLNFAVEMMQVAQAVLMPNNGLPVQQRVGVHSGPVVSGLIGHLLPKFALFGDTMNTASRMESTSLPDRIQVSQPTFTLLQDNVEEHWEATGGVQIKGKGLMETYLLAESCMTSTDKTQEQGVDTLLDTKFKSSELLPKLRPSLGGLYQDLPQYTEPASFTWPATHASSTWQLAAPTTQPLKSAPAVVTHQQSGFGAGAVPPSPAVQAEPAVQPAGVRGSYFPVWERGSDQSRQQRTGSQGLAARAASLFKLDRLSPALPAASPAQCAVQGYTRASKGSEGGQQPGSKVLFNLPHLRQHDSTPATTGPHGATNVASSTSSELHGSRQQAHGSGGSSKKGFDAFLHLLQGYQPGQCKTSG